MPRTTTILFMLAALLAPVSNTAFGVQDHDGYAERLAKVHLFAFDGVGFAGRRSTAEQAYDEIMSRPNRLEFLEIVLETGTPEAKSYALVGIYNLDRTRFGTLAPGLRSSELVVNTATGCIMRSTTLGKVVEAIVAGRYAHHV